MRAPEGATAMDFLTRYNIAINPTGLAGAAASSYTYKVHEHLTWIQRTTSGQILLAAIKFHARPVVIQPDTRPPTAMRRVGGRWSAEEGKGSSATPPLPSPCMARARLPRR